MHIKTVILLRNFSFGLINFVNLSTFFIQRFSTFFIFFIKTRFLKVFLFWGLMFFFTSMTEVTLLHVLLILMLATALL